LVPISQQNIIEPTGLLGGAPKKKEPTGLLVGRKCQDLTPMTKAVGSDISAKYHRTDGFTRRKINIEEKKINLEVQYLCNDQT
jgi:hypothetical protein